MGLFGRDDRSPEDERATAVARGSHPGAGTSPRTVIAADSRFEGTVSGSGDVQVEGEIQGAVDITSGLLVAHGGAVRGTISARQVTVSGTVIGNISATDRIELKPSAKVEGDMTSARILINDGATFDGQVLMGEPRARSGKSKAERPPTTSSARREQQRANQGSAETGAGEGGARPSQEHAAGGDPTPETADS